MPAPRPRRAPRLRSPRVPKPRHAALLLGLVMLAGCQVVDDGARQDTGVRAPSVGDSAAGEAARSDTLGDSAGVPAVPSPGDTTTVADTALVRVSPDTAALGGIIFARAEGIAVDDPRCTWQGSRIPCLRHGTGVLAIVPVGFEPSAGRGTLVFERPGRPIVREIPLESREFARELVFVSDSLRRLLARRDDIVRDARVIRRVLSSASTDGTREWSRSWRAPVQGTARGFGTERFYHPVADSGRSIRLEPDMRATGFFGIDTTVPAANAAPGWRWGGVDYDVRAGTPVVAPAAGTVADVGAYTLTGRTLIVDHGRGVLSAYYHLDTVLVRKGEELTAGRTIARVGSTGLTSRPRLHHAVFVHGRPVDPRGVREIPPFAR